MALIDFTNWWALLGMPFLISSLIATLSAPLIRWCYFHFGFLDDPTTQSHAKVIHTYAVPRGGGLVVFVGLMITSFIMIPLDKHIIGILLGAFVLTIIGVVDDIKNIHPYVRLITGFVAALCVVGAGIGIAYVTNPFGGVLRLDQPQLPLFLFGSWHNIWLLADIFAAFWIVWCMNMLNWSKGVDGQLPGIVVIAAIVIGLLSLRFAGDVTQWPVARLAAITGGSFLGLLIWNIYPQRMMPGYGAGSLAGYLLAVLSILSGAKLATLMLVLGVPMIDAIYVMIKRVRSGRSPIWGDRNHLHHAFMDLGWGKRRIAAFYWLVTASLGGIALQLNPRQKAFTIVLIGLMVGVIGGLVRWFIFSSRRHAPDNG
jgi:UDP-GlcNAc:undecaprenyl-phosphate GlcNAc-1-phosphate transferase